MFRRSAVFLVGALASVAIACAPSAPSSTGNATPGQPAASAPQPTAAAPQPTVAPAAQSAQKVTLTWASSGGSLTTAEQATLAEPYMKANPNVTINMDQPFDYAKIKAMVEANNVTWDMVETGSDYGLKGQESLLEKLDCTLIPCQDLQPDKFATTGYRVPFVTVGNGLAYRTDVYPSGKEPQGWADFYNVEKFPGKRVMWKARPQFILESALVADGVDPQKLYPLDVDRAYKKLDTIKDSVIWVGSPQECVESLANKAANMGFCFSGRAHDIAAQGAPVAFQWNQAFINGGYLVIPKGSKNVQAVMKLIAYITSAEHNADLTMKYPYGPVNPKAFDKINPDPKERAWIPGATMADKAIPLNDIWWSDNLEANATRWQEWLLKG